MIYIARCFVLTGLLFFNAAAMAGELVVAQVAPFGGSLAVAGRDFNLGAYIAFDEVNESGGVKGQLLRLVSRDDGYRPEDTVRHVVALVDSEDPVALIGLWGANSAQALITAKALDKTGLPVVGVRSGDASLRKHPLLFHVRASHRDEVARMIEQVSTMGVSRVAVVHEDEPFAREALVTAREGLLSRKMELVSVALVRRDSLDVAAAVDQLVAAQPQAVLLFTNTTVAAAFIKPFRQRRSGTYMLAPSTVEAEHLVKLLGNELAQGVSLAQAVPNPYKATVPVAMAMRNRMKLLGIAAERANFASLEGYITASVVIEALKRCKPAPRPEQVALALQGMRNFDLGGFTVNFGPNQREGSHYVDLSVISGNGKVRQ